MNFSLNMNDYEYQLWSKYLGELCGINITEAKMYLFQNKLAILARKYDCPNFSTLMSKVQSDTSMKLKKEVIETMITKETLWFRDSKPFRILENVVLKDLCKKIYNKEKSVIRIWSAASSTGQEPYSIAMTIYEMKRKGILVYPEKIQIVATDISEDNLTFCKNGEYDLMAISRGLSNDIRERYFMKKDKSWVVQNFIKDMVIFKQYNLMDSFFALGKMDIVFCRNVCIYFSDSVKKQIYQKIEKMMNKGGYLFLGASESLSLYNNTFNLKIEDRSVYYQL